jgi:hypothetical protein
MESWDVQAAKESSSRRGARQVRRIGSQRSLTTRPPRKWPQGWPCQKPQEENCRPAQRMVSPAWAQEVIEIVVRSIRSRFGDGIIGLGHKGIRFRGTGGASVQDARPA